MHPARLTAFFALVSVAVAAGVAAMAYAGVGPFKREAPQVVNLMLAGNRIVVDPAYLRGSKPREGDQSQLDLMARFPDFRPATAGAPDHRSSAATASLVFITMTAPDDAVEPPDRPAKLYARFLESEAWGHPGGLVMRRFEKGSPYEGEELFISPPDGRTFFARCTRPGPDGLPESCISEFRQAGIDVRLRFAPELLPAWQQMTDGAKGLVRSIIRNR